VDHLRRFRGVRFMSGDRRSDGALPDTGEVDGQEPARGKRRPFWQDAFILAKARGGIDIAAPSVDHLHRYIEILFEPAKRNGKEIS
jgi:hypothetical protein